MHNIPPSDDWDECPDWALGVYKSRKMTPEEEVIWRLTYASKEEWWEKFITAVLDQDKPV